jgi:hypothetical protein
MQSAIMLDVTMLSALMLSALMLNVVMQSVIMQSAVVLDVAMLSTLMLSILMLNVVMPSVMALQRRLEKRNREVEIKPRMNEGRHVGFTDDLNRVWKGHQRLETG